jgi:hypothetical protein
MSLINMQKNSEETRLGRGNPRFFGERRSGNSQRNSREQRKNSNGKPILYRDRRRARAMLSLKLAP